MSQWIITDGDSSYTFSINPNDMKIPVKSLDTKYNWQHDTGFTGDSPKKLPQPWSFSGILRTQAQYDALQTWCQASKKVTITDHLGRRFTARLTSFKPTQSSAARRSTPWRHEYTVDAHLYSLEP